VLRDLPPRSVDPNLLVGTETLDDAGVYRIAEGTAIVQTLDFFPPLVDDPFTFGQIAAANSLSDIYAMNANPLTVMNIVGFPDDELPMSVLAAILNGAADRVNAAGAVTVGGHSVRDSEIKFGLSVTGIVDPKDILTNASARPGDVLVLTKPLGTGFVTTAAKRGECPSEILAAAVKSMITLNVIGRDALRAAGGASSVTDVTGYGLAGHAAEMAEGSKTTIELDVSAVPIIAGSERLAIPRYATRASGTNRSFLTDRMTISASAERSAKLPFVFDAQTSGGLLIAVAAESAERLIDELKARNANAAAIVGRVVERRDATAIAIV
jgi:selenide,water dikinase